MCKLSTSRLVRRLRGILGPSSQSYEKVPYDNLMHFENEMKKLYQISRIGSLVCLVVVKSARSLAV
jgi:hypothetical protein